MKRLRSLAELALLRETLRQRESEAAARAAREAGERAAAERTRRVFADAVGAVTPLPTTGHRPPHPVRAEPVPRQRQLDEAAALRQAWSDEVDLESLLLTDDGLSFRRPRVGPEVVARLRRGHWAIQAEIDLHGLRREEAREALADFVRRAALQGQRCLRVVHGKGHGSPGRQPVLKAKAQRWLAQCAEVIAFAQASGPQGGAGALIVLLAGSARTVGSDGSAERVDQAAGRAQPPRRSNQ